MRFPRSLAKIFKVMRFLAILSAMLWLFGCGDERRPGRTSPYVEQNKPTAQGRSVQTVIDGEQVVAGQSFDVECRVWQDGAVVAGQSAVVITQPEAESVEQEDNRTTLKVTQAGDIYITCETGDGVVRDPQGKRVTVVPGDIAAIETSLNATSSAAGLPVGVSCEGLDAFGNSIADAQISGIESDVSILSAGSATLGYSVRGTLVGSYPIACFAGELVDDSPAILTVTPGALAQSQTSLSPASITPDQNFSVDCTVLDVYGNLVDGSSTAIFVTTADGLSAMDSVQAQNDGTYNIQSAGTYYVFCYVPGTLAGDESPAALEVVPGAPYAWTVDLATTDCFSPNRTLPLDIKVYDAWDNLIEAPPLSVEFTPATGINLQDDGTYLIEEEGLYGLSIAIESSALAVGATIDSPRSFDLVVDGLGPEINITTPERAAYITSSSTTQNVTLSVSDTVSEISAFTFNGVDHISELSAGTFSLSMDSRWGLNIIEASASDACGNQTLLSQSYLQGDTFLDADNGVAQSGMGGFLSQNVLDDTDRSDVDDLATIAWSILKDIDLDAEIDDIIAVSPDANGDGNIDQTSYDCIAWTEINYETGYKVTKTAALTYDEPVLSFLDAIDGGLKTRLSISSLDLPLRVNGRLDAGCLGESSATVNGNVTVDSIVVDVTNINLAITNGVATATICEDCIDVTLNNFNIDIDWGVLSIIGGLLDAIEDAITDLFTDDLEDMMAQELRDTMPPIIEEFLNDFDLSTSITLPEPLSTNLNIASQLDAITFSAAPGAGGLLGLSTRIYPDERGENIPANAPGPLAKSNALVDLSTIAQDFSVAIKDDVFNQILWALWYGGTFDLAQSAVDELLTGESAEGIDVSFAFHLPPVMMQAPDDPSAFQIGIGDAYLALDIDTEQALGIATDEGTLEVGVYLSALLGATLGFDASTNVLTLSVESEPEIYVHVASLTNPAYQAIVTMLIEETLAYLLPQFFDGFVESFPLPEFDVGGKAGLASGAIWRLANGQLQTRQSGDAYTVLSGDLALVE
ncbi:MAG: hypothetical protein CMH60_05530 [Myxococcales bacterium]|nr:hypothetical protein [Myxococcales bacterium]